MNRDLRRSHRATPGTNPIRRYLVVRRLTVLGVLVSLLLAACGVPLDDTPREIALSTSTTTVVTTTTTDPSDQTNADLFFVDGNSSLRPKSVSLDNPSVAGAVAELLSTTPPADWKSRIPSGTRLLETHTRGERVTIDLSNEMHDIESPLDRIAYAQLTFTALQFDELTQVTFEIEGTPVDAPTDDGNRKIVTERDYLYPLNPN